MDKLSIKTRIKLFLASIGWKLFIWGNDNSEEKYWAEIVEQERNYKKPILSYFKTIDGFDVIPGEPVHFTKIGINQLYEPVANTIQHEYVMGKKEMYCFLLRSNAVKFIETKNRRILNKMEAIRQTIKNIEDNGRKK